MNGVADENCLPSVYRSIKPKRSASAEVTADSRPKLGSILHDKLTQGLDEGSKQKCDKSAPDSSATCNGHSASAADDDEVPDNVSSNSVSKSILLDSTTEVVNSIATPVTSNFSNIVLLNQLTKAGIKGDSLKNSKVYVLNGNVLKEASDLEKGKTDSGNVNYICLTNNFGNIIKKIKCDNIVKNGKPVVSSSSSSVGGGGGGVDADSEKPKILSTVPTFIQLSNANFKTTGNPKIAFTVSPTLVAKPAVGNYEILRSKLMENLTPAASVSSQPPSKDGSAVRLKSGDKSGSATLSSKKEQLPDSPAVAKARNDLVKCRKALIEAAIHPQLPTYTPPASYSGPTHTCEECEDTFASTDGLNNHKNRRCVLFTYACPVCKKTLEFYNRCMFLLHVRSHDVAVKACFLTISVIPASKLNFQVLDNEQFTSEIESPTQPETNSSSISPEQSPCVADETPSVIAAAPQNTQVVHIFKKRKTSSTHSEEAADDNSPTVEEEQQLVDSSAKSEPNDSSRSEPSSSSDSASAEDTRATSTTVENKASQPNRTSRPVTIRTTKLKKKRLLSTLLTKPILKPANIDNSAATYTTTNSTSTTFTPVTTSSTAVTTESSVSVNAGGDTMAVATAGRTRHSPKNSVSSLPKSSFKSGGNLDEICLTSSDEDETVPTDAEKNHPVACRECKEDVPSLTSHYRASNRPLKEFPCEQCKFFNPSACALSAHMRMHSRSVPYICPDCGFYFSTIDSFLIHVKQVCFYDFKTIRFKCPECSLLKPSVPQFADHLKRCHIREVFKCSVCITSSYSARVVQTHMERVHPEAPKNVLEGFRCMLCPNVLVAKQSINVHVKKHVFGLQHLRYVYICKCCKKYASGSMSKFEAHYHSCAERIARSPSPLERRASGSKKGATAASATTGGRKEAAAVAASSSSSSSEKAGAEKDPLSVEEWEADKLKAEYVPKTKWCVMCLTTKLNEHSRSLFCSACVSFVNADGTNTASSASPAEGEAGAAAEKTDATGRSKRKLKCKLCKQLLTRDWSTITNHYLQDHHADFNVSVSKSSRVTASIAAGSGGGAGGSSNHYSGSASRKRKSSSLKQHDVVAASSPTNTAASAAAASSSNSIGNTPTVSTAVVTTTFAASTTTTAVAIATTSSVGATTSGLTPAKVSKLECKYRCVKCGFSTNVRNDFHEHIVSHKTQSNTNYQCLECGECFIVKPSLEKHLIVVHKVRDINEYYKENKIGGGGSSDDDDDEDDEKSKTKKELADNQCEVCYMECDSKQQYDRHIRTHGMAFVTKQSRAKS